MILSMAASQLSQLGCASGLDFDHVSSGRHGPDADSHGADAGGVIETTLRTAANPTPEDAGALGMSLPDAGAQLADARPPAAAGSSAAAVAVDAGSHTTTASVDAGSFDAATAADPAAFSCATLSPKPWFCDDFETLALSSHWSEVVIIPTNPLPNATIDIDGNAARAGYYSLLAEVNDSPSACCIGAYAALTLPTLQGPTKLTAELDVRVEQIDPKVDQHVTLFQIWWGTAETGYTQHTLQLESHGGSMKTGLVEIATDPRPAGSTEDPHARFSERPWEWTPVLSEWAHVVYELDVQDALATANLARVTVDDVVLFDGPLLFALQPATAHMEIGFPLVASASPQAQDRSVHWRVRYDNVLVRYEPR